MQDAAMRIDGRVREQGWEARRRERKKNRDVTPGLLRRLVFSRVGRQGRRREVLSGKACLSQSGRALGEVTALITLGSADER